MTTALSARHETRLGTVSTCELEKALRTGLVGDRERIEVRERRPMAYRSTFPLEELRVLRGDADEEWLVWKDLSRRGPTDPVWRVKAGFLHDPTREIAVYRDVLDPSGMSVPRYRGAFVDADCGRNWLFLERIRGEPLWQRDEVAVWRAAARWLARLHSSFAGGTTGISRRLLRYDPHYFRLWLARARRFVRWPESLAAGHRDFDWLAARTLDALEWLSTQPATLVHGEFYPSNVMVETPSGRPRIRPVDWEMAGLGPGLLDLAALTSGAWSSTDREALTRAYREALPVEMRPSAATLRRGVERCRLLLAVQWLGWSQDWTPPTHHAQDWLAVAVQLAADLPKGGES
jgi:aminoglycoside phosphotransferase (APT) family kinase protein